MKEGAYGIRRVMEPGSVLPTIAWKVDNSREIYSDEMRIGIRKIHLEGTSFKQISMESNNNEEAIKSKIIDIVIKRGKLHNPVTDTGGLLYGVVEEIGSEYNNKRGLKIGDEVLCNTSLTTVPIYISRITDVNRAFGQVKAEGYAIAFNEIPVIKKPQDVPVDLLLFTFNESGTLFSVSKEAIDKRNFLVVGNNLMMNLLYGHAVRRVVGKEASIVCLLDKKTELVLSGKKVDELLARVFNEIHFVNILKPLECMDRLNIDSLFDISINCADIPGAETINILATRSGGSVFFANLINNYNIALYITESISRHLNIRCADGYLEAYDEFDIQMTKELVPYLADAQTRKPPLDDNPAYPLSKSEHLKEASGFRVAQSEGFVCESRAMVAVMDEALNVAKYDCHVLITGETGVGKEKLANVIQKNSSRKLQPYIKVNCASIAPNLMESEFFGYEKGAFTGASQSGKKGYFELADNGIIFLDEIGELPADMQAKLLRVIQDGEFYRIGGTTPIMTNVRVISATNRNLEELVEQKLFRRDLYYRLNVFPIRVPSLEERPGDIPPLIHYFIKQYGEKFGIARGVNEDAVDYLKNYSWPGNIRELENLMQRLMISAKGENISLLDVMHEFHRSIFENSGVPIDGHGTDLSLEDAVGNFERNILKHAKETYKSSRKAAAALGISQTQYVRKINKYNL